MKKRLKKWWWMPLVLLAVTEVILRLGWGIGNPPIYISDPDYEYIYAPNQDLVRLGNHILTNEHSMRSKPLRKDDKVRILKIGDSVIHGGSHTDHDSLASTLLENWLTRDFGENVRVLNISAGSWGPANGLAYLEKHGDFDANIIVLAYSSHDLFDHPTFQPVVGIDPSYPAQKPLLALGELWNKYVSPKIFGQPSVSDDHWNPEALSASDTTTALQGLLEYARQKNCPVVAYQHPTLSELKAGQYDPEGEYMLSLYRPYRMKVAQGIRLLKPENYRDDIHLNESGQRVLAQALYPYLKGIVHLGFNR